MPSNLIVHTHVNEVISGAISNVTLKVEQARDIVLSATIAIGETTVGKLQSTTINSDNKKLIEEAFALIINELHTHGIENIEVDTIGCDLPEELNCSVVTIT